MEAFSQLDLKTEASFLDVQTKSFESTGNTPAFMPHQERRDDKAIVEKLIKLGFFTKVGEEQYKLSDRWLKERGTVI